LLHQKKYKQNNQYIIMGDIMQQCLAASAGVPKIERSACGQRWTQRKKVASQCAEEDATALTVKRIY
jgi:hypothetical protein